MLALEDVELAEGSDWLSAFKTRHASRPTGNFRYDAVRFAHKVAAIDIALSAADADVLVWMDADCVTHESVDGEWLTGLVGDADFAYLRRVGKYPECGFMMFRLSERTRAFVDSVVDLYKSDRLFDLQEWHDSWAIEHQRFQFEANGLLQCRSLSGDAESTGHPLVNGPLGARLDHLKGTRKQEGRSRARDLKSSREERYWNG